jgi:N-acetylglucosamine-6-phosphate deacetylase
MKIIDIHTYGIGGYDTRSKKVEDILKIAEIFGAQGISEIILNIYPSSIKVMRENMMTVKKAMERQHSALRTPHSALILGVHLEGPFLNPSKCGALAARAFLKPTEYNFRQLIEGFEDIVKIITIAPEIKGAIKLIKKISGRRVIVNMGHSDATFSEAEAGFNSGARGITHIFNTMRGFYHREPGIAGFGLINEDIYIEVIADPFHLHPKTLELIFKTKNLKRIIIVSDSVKETPSCVTCTWVTF